MSTSGVIEATVLKETDSATVEHEASISVESLIEVIGDAGFGATVISTNPNPPIRNGDMEETFPIAGMHCGSCAEAIHSALTSTPGVTAAVVSKPTDSARVTYDPAVVFREKLVEVIEDCGFDVVAEAPQPISHSTVPVAQRKESRDVEVHVLGMTCGQCESWIKAAVLTVDGVQTAQVSHADNLVKKVQCPYLLSFGLNGQPLVPGARRLTPELYTCICVVECPKYTPDHPTLLSHYELHTFWPNPRVMPVQVSGTMDTQAVVDTIVRTGYPAFLKPLLDVEVSHVSQADLTSPLLEVRCGESKTGWDGVPPDMDAKGCVTVRQTSHRTRCGSPRVGCRELIG
eukprot:1921506-Pyramimonas_sp.AAC.1